MYVLQGEDVNEDEVCWSIVGSLGIRRDLLSDRFQPIIVALKVTLFADTYAPLRRLPMPG